MACGILVPQAGIEPGPLAVEAQSPNHWTAGEFPDLHFKWGGGGCRVDVGRPVRELLPVTQIREARDMDDRGSGAQWWQVRPQPTSLASHFTRVPHS